MSTRPRVFFKALPVFLILSLSCLSVFPVTVVALADIAVIVIKNNSTQEISISDLSRIYEGRQTSWKDGSDILVVNRPPESDIRKVFYHVVLNTEPTQQFYQPGNPTPFHALIQVSDLAAKRLVAKLPNAISYIESSQADETVKVVAEL